MHLIYQQKNDFGAEKNEFRVSQSSSDNQYVNTEKALDEFKLLYQDEMELYECLQEEERVLARKRSAILKDLKTKFGASPFMDTLIEKYPEWSI